MLPGSILQKLMYERREAKDLGRDVPAEASKNISKVAQAQSTQVSGRTPLNFGVYYKNTLVALCHALEDAVLATKTSPLIVTAFQKGKWYLQEADRYADLADTADRIVILAAPGAGFREHPTSDRDNVELVDLSTDDPVSEEWHLMIMSSKYSAMVLCQELTEDEYGPAGKPENDLERKFYGFWTFDPALVKETIAITADHIGQYNAQLETELEGRLADIDTQAASKTGEVGNVVMRVVDYLKGGDRQVEETETFKFAGALSQNLASNELQAYLRMAQLADLADVTNPLAAAEVASLCEMMGQFLDLPVWQMQRLRLASLLHRIAPAQLESGAAGTEGDSCPLNPGAQTLRVLPRLRAIAQIIAHQHEWWDGTGQPAGLAGDNIPVEARVLGLIAAFQHAVAYRRHEDTQQSSPMAQDEWQYVTDAFADCKAQSGERWDPKLLEILSFLVSGLQQGLSLPSIPLKMTLGTGIIDPDVVDSWPTYQPIKTSAPK